MSNSGSNPSPDAAWKSERLSIVSSRRRSVLVSNVAGAQLQINTSEQEISSRTITERINRNRFPLSSFLVSLILHTSLFVLLAWLAIVVPQKTPLLLTAVLISDPSLETPADDTKTIEFHLADDAESLLESHFEDISKDDLLEAAANEDVSIAPPSEAEGVANDQPTVAHGTVASAPKGGGLEGRKHENRAKLASDNGATDASEAAVEQGLRWLAIHQHKNGSWHLQLDTGPCKGQCRDSGTIESQNAATGLALLAFLGAGYTHESGRYQDQVGLGLGYLQGRMRKTPVGGSLIDDSMYAHGIATVALAEAYNMTRDERLRESVELAVAYIVAAQHARGGWRYQPGLPGDMTVTGWQLMALKSAQMAGVEVPAEVFEKASRFLDSLSESGGSFYGYQSSEKQPTTTAIGLLMRMYLGWPRDHGGLDQGAELLVDHGPARYDIYFNYYATQVLHHLSHEKWRDWNQEMREHLLRHQYKIGHEEGSWHFADEHGSVGGRVYTTAMAIMILEVYYRYMPLYDKQAVK